MASDRSYLTYSDNLEGKFTVPIINLGSEDKPYSTKVLSTGSSGGSSRAASYESRTLPNEKAATGSFRGVYSYSPQFPRKGYQFGDYSSKSLPRPGEKHLEYYTSGDPMDGDDVKREIKVSKLSGRRSISPDQQFEVKITTKKKKTVVDSRTHNVFDMNRDEADSNTPVLGRDKTWVMVQKKTFTNWFRDRVKGNASKELNDLQTDLEDGKLLHDLIRALTEGKHGNRVPHKNPSLRVQKIENINVALMAMKTENVRLESIGAEDICDGNLKLILGMIWCLICRYQIADISTTTRKISAKKVLLQWMQAQLPQHHITNFTKDWNNGITLAALIDSLQPGLIPDWQSWSPSTSRENVARAMAIAEENFDIPQIIEPEDMAASHPDELSVMCYLSYFCGPDSIGFHTLKNWVNGRIPEPHITNFSSDWKDGRALCTLIDSFIPGHMPSEEEIYRQPPIQNVSEGMDFAKKRLGVEPNLLAEEFVNPDIDPLSVMTYISRYRSAKPTIDEAQLVSVVGTGVSGGSVGQEASFFVRHIPPGGKVTVVVTGPDGSDIPVNQRITETGALQILYTPTIPGTYIVAVMLDGKHINGSPFKVTHHAVPQPSNCLVSGAGLSRAQVGQWAEFQVDCMRAGPGSLGVQVLSPQGELDHEVENKSDKVFGVKFEPVAVGEIKIGLTWAGLPIPGGPYLCQVSDPSKCIASGPGLSGGKLGQTTSFTVSTVGAGPGSLDTSIFGPDGTVPIDRVDEDGEVNFSYTPQHQGSYLIDVKWDGFPIRGSPFKVRPAAAVDASRVIVMKPPSTIKAGQETSFMVNTRSAGHGVLKAEARGPKITEKCQIFQQEEGLYRVSFTPTEVGKIEVDVTYGGTSVPGTPFQVQSKDPYRCVVDTKAVSGQTIRANETVVIPVSTKLAGDGVITATARGPTGLFDLSCSKQAPGFYNVMFTPTVPGLHLLDIYFDKDPVLDSAVQINVEPPGDIIFEKPPTHDGYYYTDEQLDFVARTEDDDPTELKVYAYGTKSNSIPRVAIERYPGVGQVIHCTASYPDDYRLEVSYGGQPISGSPFLLPVVNPPNASAVVLGDPVIPLEAGRPVEVAVDATRAGTGGLTCSASGKSAGVVRADITEVAPNQYNIYFVPPIEDTYTLNVQWSKDSVPGTPVVIPFSREEEEPTVQVVVEPDKDEVGHLSASAVSRGMGEGVAVEVRQFEKGKYRVSFEPPTPDLYDLQVEWNGQPLDGMPFEIDCRSLETALSLTDLSTLTAEVIGDSAGEIPVEVVPVDNGDFEISFLAKHKELHQMNLFWQKRKIKGSPFEIDNRRRQ